MRALLIALFLSFSLCFSALASESTPEEQYQIAVEYWQTEDQSQKAIELWRDVALSNEHIPSMWSLAIAYLQGTKIDRNMAEAIQWLTRLSDLGQADAKELIGDLYYYGRGVPQDYAMAVKWYENYVEFEQDSDILIRYATLLATGQGTPKNLIAAWRMLHIASNDNRYKLSTYLIATMVFNQMNPFEQFQVRFFLNQQQ